MATTRIISMHRNSGKTVAQCLTDRTDYAKNPEKTKDGELITTAKIVRRGRSIVVAEAEVRKDDGTLLATAGASFWVS